MNDCSAKRISKEENKPNLCSVNEKRNKTEKGKKELYKSVTTGSIKLISDLVYF